MLNKPDCPLCEQPQPADFGQVQQRQYWQCRHCRLVFLDPACRPSPDKELSEYLLHENDADDAYYREFLAPLTSTLLERVPAGAAGLDYGCGPGPAAAAMLQEQGLSVALYDPFFAPSSAPLQDSYDFVFCSEVAEHFHKPALEFERLAKLLKPSGWLAIMTNLHHERIDFAGWHYRRDPTHVVFYAQETMEWLAARYDWTLTRPHPRVSLFQRKD